MAIAHGPLVDGDQLIVIGLRPVTFLITRKRLRSHAAHRIRMRMSPRHLLGQIRRLT
ncbi:MAG: hypothetical protein QM749_18085 [Aquabacterium sp.]